MEKKIEKNLIIILAIFLYLKKNSVEIRLIFEKKRPSRQPPTFIASQRLLYPAENTVSVSLFRTRKKFVHEELLNSSEIEDMRKVQ